MAFKNKLLATAAIPLIALTWMSPVAAAELLRPSAPTEVQSLVVKVQADDEELLKQKRQERREKRRQQAEQTDQTQQSDQDQEPVKPRRKKQQAADDQQMQQDDSGQVQTQQSDEEPVKPRRKKHQAADDQQMQQDDSGQVQTQQSDEEPVKPRRKKHQAADDQQMQQDDSGQVQTQQSDEEPVKPRRKKHQAADDQQMQQDDSGQVQTQQSDEEPVKPRRKKHQAADDQQMQQDDSGQMQTQQSDEETVKPRRKKHEDNATDQSQSDDEQLKNAIDKNNKKHRKQNAGDDQQMQQDNADQAQQGDEETVKPRHKKQLDNATSDDNQSTDDKLKNAIDKNKRKKHGQDQDQAEEPSDNNGTADENNKAERRPVDVKKAKDIASDPSKTTDTVVLPVENGAAVLDSDKDADKGGTDRNRRKREREEVKARPAPKSDKDAQGGFKDDDQIRIKPVLELKGEHIPGFKGYDDFGGRRVGDRDNRVVIKIDGRIVIRSDDDRRIARNTEIRYERLPNNLVREVVIQANGDRIVTVRNRYGEIVRRSRIERDDREIVIFYSPDLERGRDRLFLRDAGDDLPPMRLTIPVDDYIIDVSGNGGHRNYEQFLEEPPVERVERVYSVDEVKNSARIRDKMRRIDLDTITFETGSADVAEDQVQSLKQVGQAIKNVLDKDPGETFLIEGHTDAVGSDESNLVLSDQRAESIANVLSEAFDIPAENLVTQGYGERYLKIDSDGPVRENRRVTIRRITPLVRPLAAAEQ